MKDIVYVLTQSEFWIAVGFIAVFVFVIFAVFEDAVSVIKANREEETLVAFEVVPEPLEVGCNVYDVVTGGIGKYCGTHLGDDNNLYAIVVQTEGNCIRYYYCIADSLLRIK